jgi:glutamyl-tRNA synthetase
MIEKKVVTRFAPSPTGFMHVGGVRTALYAYLYAKKHNGTFILRIEDTDKEREVSGATEHIMKSLRFILSGDETLEKIDPWDFGPNNPGEFGSCIQSERLDIYNNYAQKLFDAGLAYTDPYSNDEITAFREQSERAKAPFLYRNHRPKEFSSVWDKTKPLRFKTPTIGRTDWSDAVRGKLTAGAEALDDFIIMKSDGYPTYNFCHIVDDIEMGVTHVMRGEEFIPSTPKFISMYSALQTVLPEKSIELPIFVTLPPILGETGTKKLSKRDGAKDVLEYHTEGYLPEALANYLALQGWNPGGEQEIFTMNELIDLFNISRIQKSGARWNEDKLLWVNKKHMTDKYKEHPKGETLCKRDFYNALPDFVVRDPRFKEQQYPAGSIGSSPDWTTSFHALFERYFERISFWGELTQDLIKAELEMIIDRPNVSKDLVVRDLDINETKLILGEVYNLLYTSDEIVWSEKYLRELLSIAITTHGTKKVLWPLRVSLSGQEKSVDPFSLLRMIGKEEALHRIQNVLDSI